MFGVYNVISHNGTMRLRRNMLSTTYHTIMTRVIRVNLQFVNNRLKVLDVTMHVKCNVGERYNK
jgi:hypothetical protein